MTMSEGEPDADTEAVGPAIRRAVARIYRRVRAEMNDGQLGDTATAVLAYVVTQGPQTPRALSKRERVSPPAMNQTVNALQSAGLVTRGSDPSDGRQVLVAATEEGVELAARVREAKHSWLNARLDALSAGERRVLAEAARILDEMAGS